MNDAPIFIVGAFRSGTTLLRLMLHRHSRLAIPPETHFIPDFDRDLGRTPTPDAFLDALAHHERFTDLELPLDLIREAVLQAPARLETQLQAMYRVYAQHHGKARWGDKTPCYVRRLPLLSSLFPQLQVIHLIRDGRDVAASLLDVPWFDGDATKAARRWRQRVETGRKDGAALGPDQYLEVRYEDLADKPEEVLQTCCAFLGERFEPQMLDFHQDASNTVPTDQQSYHAQTKQPVHRGRVARWRTALSEQQIRDVEDFAGPLLRDLGYATSRHPAWGWVSRGRRMGGRVVERLSGRDGESR